MVRKDGLCGKEAEYDDAADDERWSGLLLLLLLVWADWVGLVEDEFLEIFLNGVLDSWPAGLLLLFVVVVLVVVSLLLSASL
jgi:hypothetical protein